MWRPHAAARNWFDGLEIVEVNKRHVFALGSYDRLREKQLLRIRRAGDESVFREKRDAYDYLERDRGKLVASLKDSTFPSACGPDLAGSQIAYTTGSADWLLKR